MPKRIIQPLDTGRYFIINVKLQTFARLPDANISSEIVSSINKEDPGTKWNVHLLSNGKFTLQNFDFGLYAIREPSAGRGENATGGTLGQQWNIQEVKKPGHFVISPPDTQVYLGLRDSTEGIPVTFSNTSNDPKNQWIFTRVSEYKD